MQCLKITKKFKKKRKKSGAENKRASKARKEKNEKLGSFMVNYFTTSSESSMQNDGTSINDEGPGDTAKRDKEDQWKTKGLKMLGKIQIQTTHRMPIKTTS